MLRSTQTFLLASLIILLAACETVVDVDIPDETSRLVPNAFLEDGQPMVLRLTQSQSILTNRPLQAVSGAAVTVQEEDGEEINLIEEPETPGVYYAARRAVAGERYTLSITKDGFESAEATAFIRDPIAIEALDYDTTVTRYRYDYGDSIVVGEDIDISEMRITFDDPAAERNFYELAVIIRQSYVETVYDEEGNPFTDTVVYYIQQYLESDDPAFAGSQGDFVEGEDAVYGELLTFSDEFLNGDRYTLRFKPQIYFYGEGDSRTVLVVLRTISEERYLYFQSADLQYYNDGNPFAEPVQVYSNVSNGFGIFAGFSADSVKVEF